MNAPAPSGANAAAEGVGDEMYALAAELYPLHRSITGPGLRATLEALAARIPLELHEIPSGTPVFDWEIPPEWTLRDAYVADPETGERLIDVADSNLHVVAYSGPVQERMRWRDLRDRIHSRPDQPGRIPYRTGYWNDGWGFCARHDTVRELDRRPDRELEVVIDATIEPGSLTWGEATLPGERREEVLIWAHACHPSLANDNLSGIVVATRLARWLAGRARRLTYRIVFAPATIGALAWLWERRDRVDRIRAGLVLAVCGDPGPVTYKRSRRGDATIDRAIERVLAETGEPHEVRGFTPTGYDERQFGSPGFDLPVGVLMRTPNGEYPEYHTSADDLSLITPAALADTWAVASSALEIVDANATCRNLRPMGEPRLGRHGLYRAWGEAPDATRAQEAALWVLNQSDGEHDLLEIADRAGLPFPLVREAADLLIEAGLLEEPGPTETETTPHRKELP